MVLVRALSMLKHFESARLTMGHVASILATVQAVKAELPGIKGVNRAEVERVLAELQPKEQSNVFRVREFGNSSGGALFVGARRTRRNILR
jgi:hypothetical protein